MLRNTILTTVTLSFDILYTLILKTTPRNKFLLAKDSLPVQSDKILAVIIRHENIHPQLEFAFLYQKRVDERLLYNNPTMGCNDLAAV